MRSYEDAKSRPQGYLMLDLKPKTNDQERLKTKVLPGEIAKFIQKQSYRQPPLVNVMYDAERHSLAQWKKSKLYSDQINRFLIFKNKMDVPAQAPVQRTSLVSPTPVSRAFFNIQAGGANAPPVPPCAPPRNHILPPPGKVPFP